MISTGVISLLIRRTRGFIRSCLNYAKSSSLLSHDSMRKISNSGKIYSMPGIVRSVLTLIHTYSVTVQGMCVRAAVCKHQREFVVLV